MVADDAQRNHGPSAEQTLDASAAAARLHENRNSVDHTSMDQNTHHILNQQQFSQPGSSNVQQRGRVPPSTAFNMGGMASALPGYQNFTNVQSSSYEQQHAFGAAPASVQGYNSQPFSNQLSPGSYPVNPSHYASFQDHGSSQQVYNSTHGTHQPHSSGPSPIDSAFPTPYYPGQPHRHQQPQHYMQFAGQFGPPAQVAFQTPFPPSHGMGYGNHVGDLPHFMGRPPRSAHTPHGAYPSPTGQFLRPGNSQGATSRGSPSSSGGSIPSTPRGPPRKPKRSGNALWVGNLPSGTFVGNLKDHFSRDATKDIESVFLISKSNCAFVNYRTEAACAAAMTRFHDSRFNGVRLVCRLRRGTTTSPVPGVPTGPAALMSPPSHNQTAAESIAQNRHVSSQAAERAAANPTHPDEPQGKPLDKYFVMKSLTIEDMELSVRNNIWATQAHNEEALNGAYESADNVFLIFSANKSGEYFGFARMASPINEEAAANLDWAPRGQTVVDDPDLPRSIATPATEWAPKGRIIDDSARGTIFWEADLDDDIPTTVADTETKETSDTEATTEPPSDVDEGATTGDVQTFGKPFKIQWVTTNRLPFYRTRGLRNPWNANREVKIARDGTELETGVGRRLVQMFQRPPGDQQTASTDPSPAI